MRRSTSSSSYATFQPIESRRLLSGNVAVAFDGQLLDVRGDELNNNAVITQALNGAITITGQNGTLINGLPSVRFANGLAIETLDVRMEGGDDRLTINRLNIAGDVNADMGVNLLGRDTVAINNSSIQGSLFAFGGRDLDTINVSGTTVFGDVTIDLAEGAGRSTVTNSTFNGSANLVGGEGNDAFNATGMTVGLELKLDTKEGSDTVNYSSSSASIANISTGLGVDLIRVAGFSSAEDFVVEAGDGNDLANLSGVSALKNLVVNMDSGNDILTVASSSAGQDAILVGGAGVDRLTDLGLTAGVKKEVVEFEFVA